MSVQSIVSQNHNNYGRYGACDGDGWTPKLPVPPGSCDGDGWTPKVSIPRPGTLLGTSGILRPKKPAKNDPAATYTPSAQAEAEATQNSNKKGKALTVAILLIGGALLGYGHRKYIEKGVNSVKTKVAEWASTGKAAEWVQKGKDLLTKAKDAIMAKPPVA